MQSTLTRKCKTTVTNEGDERVKTQKCKTTTRTKKIAAGESRASQPAPVAPPAASSERPGAEIADGHIQQIREALSRHRQLLPAMQRALAQTRLVSEMQREPHADSDNLRRALSEALDRIARAIEPLQSVVTARVGRYLHVVLSVYRKKVADSSASLAAVRNARQFLQKMLP